MSVFMHLFHGRNDPDEILDDWGFEGPVIGPLKFVHVTYMGDVKVEFEKAEDFQRFFPSEPKCCGYSYSDAASASGLAPSFDEVAADPEKYKALGITPTYRTDWVFRFREDLMEHDNKYYGDWSVTSEEKK